MKMRVQTVFGGLLGGFLACAVSGQTVAHWSFEEGSPGATASGAGTVVEYANGMNGTPTGGPTYRAVLASIGDIGLEFDGTNDKVKIPDHPLFAITESLTVEAIIRVDALSPAPPGNPFNQIIFRGDNRGGLDPYFLAVRGPTQSSSGHLHFSIANGQGQSANAISPDPLPFGRLLHVAGVLNDESGMISLFVNGTLVTSFVTDLRPFADLDPLRDPSIGIGALSASSGQWFEGVIAEVRISSAALEPYEFLSSGCIANIALPVEVLDLQDVLAFIDGFLQQELVADMDGNGIFDLVDVNLFIDAFLRGCP